MVHGQTLEERCDRCERLVAKLHMSTIHEEAICGDCLKMEQEHLARLKLDGISPTTIAGSGGAREDEIEETYEGR